MTPADDTVERDDPPPGAVPRAEDSPSPSLVLRGWIRRRARNVRQRPLPAAVVGGAVFVAALLATVILPGAADRAAAGPPPPARARPDTLAILHHALALRQAASDADARLTAALAASSPGRDTAMRGPRTRADSLAAAIATLDRLDSLLDRAPLPSSYRALGGAWPIRDDPRVRALLDSLERVEQRRAALSAAGGGVDSSYVALTATTAGIGRALRAVARARRSLLHRELGSAGGAGGGADTAALHRARDSVYLALASARRWLTQARMVDAELDARAARTRARAARAAAVPAALLASLVVGVVIGFAVAFAMELRTPRVADAAEAETLVWAPVVARIPPGGASQPRRRAADRDVPRLIQVRGGAYDTLYERVTDGVLDPGLLVVTGDDPAATALVALNLGATAARRVRSTIVVDADLRGAVATRAVRCHAAQGLADVLAGLAEWAALANCVIVGRERTMELLPSSGDHGGSAMESAAAKDPTPLLLQLRRRYDAVIVSAPREEGGESAAVARAADRTLVVVRAAHTPVLELARLVAVLRNSGARVGGIVLWQGDVPPIPVGAAASRAVDSSVATTGVGR